LRTVDRCVGETCRRGDPHERSGKLSIWRETAARSETRDRWQRLRWSGSAARTT